MFGYIYRAANFQSISQSFSPIKFENNEDALHNLPEQKVMSQIIRWKREEEIDQYVFFRDDWFWNDIHLQKK